MCTVIHPPTELLFVTFYYILVIKRKKKLMANSSQNITDDPHCRITTARGEIIKTLSPKAKPFPEPDGVKMCAISF